MPYNIAWYVEKHVVYVRYWDKLTADEFQAYLRRVEREYLDYGHSALVHIIVNTTEATSLPTLQQLASGIGKEIHPKSGWMVTLGDIHPTTKWIGEFASRLFKFRYRNFRTMPEAVTFLKEMDPTIDWSQADESVVR